MRRTLIISAIVVAVLWVAAVVVRLLLPWGAHLVGLADIILYWVAVAATVVLTAMVFYSLLHRQPLLMRIAGWAFYLLIGLEGMLVAAVIGSTVLIASWAMLSPAGRSRRRCPSAAATACPPGASRRRIWPRRCRPAWAERTRP